ncbi:hypothetical protein FQZ97_1245360 [compost metagenome]
MRQVLVADAYIRLAPGLADTKAYFTAVAYLAAQVQAEAVALQAVFGYRVVVQSGFDIL